MHDLADRRHRTGFLDAEHGLLAGKCHDLADGADADRVFRPCKDPHPDRIDDACFHRYGIVKLDQGAHDAAHTGRALLARDDVVGADDDIAARRHPGRTCLHGAVGIGPVDHLVHAPARLNPDLGRIGLAGQVELLG